MKKLLDITILLFFIGFSTVFSLEGAEFYEAGLENYKQKQNETALEQLIEFRNLNPESNKADDALWYISRLYERLERVDDAETSFREVLEIQDSNRLAEVPMI